MKRSFRQRVKVLSAGLAFMMMLSGCAFFQKKEAPPPAPAPPAPFPEPAPTPQPTPAPRLPQPVPAPTPRPAPAPQPPGPSSVPPAEPVPEQTRYFVHTVKFSGETISIIAGWYLGDIMKFQILIDANPQIADPKVIRMGDKINIPARLTDANVKVRQDPMTKEYVDSFYKSPKSPPPPKKGDKGKEPETYGPR
jgi:hypothetical protein